MAEKTTLNKIKKDAVVIVNDNYYKVTEKTHSKMARGSGIVKLKLKDLSDGHSTNHNGGSDQEIELADYTTNKGQYLYTDGDDHFFMDKVTYEQYQYPIKTDENLGYYLKEDVEVSLNLTSTKLLSVSPPIKITLEVVEAPPNEKGDTASGATKQVTLDTGLIVNVPLFVEAGEKIIINTLDNSYVERAK